MLSILKNSDYRKLVLAGIRFSRSSVLYASFASVLFIAQFATVDADSLSVSVTPPLFQLALSPGDSWTSNLKVVNSNPYDVTYYTQVVDFEPKGEDGASTFVPLVEQGNDPSRTPYSLASWIEISPDPVSVPAGRSAEIPFSIRVPENAEPGGHYGAVLVGTQPGQAQGQGAVVKVSSFVSSLFFLKIKGDVIESGRIREFTSEKELYQEPKANFVLRFENTGNTHLKPRGDIAIYNMWGKQRGKLAINQENGNFGNVLPKSVRRFQFAWEGDSDPFDIGPYSAVVTLQYGEDGKQNVTAKTYFWIVPIVPVSIGLGSLAFFLVLMTWLIRRYIRRSLEIERARYVPVPPAVPMPQAQPLSVRESVRTVEALVEPLREGVIDLRSIGKKPSAPTPSVVQMPSRIAREQVPVGNYAGETRTLGQFLYKYKLFILFLLALSTAIGLSWYYFGKVLVPEKRFEIRDVSIREEIVAPEGVVGM